MIQRDDRRAFLKKTALLAGSVASPLFASTSGAQASASKGKTMMPAGTGVLSRAAVGSVSLQGSLGQRYTKNIDYLLWRYKDIDRLLFPFEHRGKWMRIRDWDGEYAGKWLDAAVLTASSSRSAELRDACNRVAARLRATQETDGYLGTELPENRLRPGWPHWMHWLAMKSLREHGQRFGDEESLKAAVRAGEWVLHTYHPITSENSNFYRGDGTPELTEEVAQKHGITVIEAKNGVLSILDELAELHAVTGNKAYLEFGAAAVAHLPLMQKMRSDGTAQPMHAYSLMSYLGGAALIAQRSGDAQQLSWIQKVWDDIAQNHLFPTGSTSTKEYLAVPPADVPEGNLQETCATVEWIMLSHRLYLATGEVRYANMIERTVRNALLAAQSMDGRKWTYFTPLQSNKKWFGGATDCCYFSGPRGVARIPELLYHLDADGVRVDLFENSTARLTIGAQPVTLVQKTEYPARGFMRLSIESSAPQAFTVKLRLPENCVNPRLRVNGKPVSVAASAGSHIAIQRIWRTGDAVELEFEPRTWRAVMSDGNAVVMRGVEALSFDRRDNEADMQEVRLLDSGELRTAEPREGRNRYAYQVEAAGKAAPVLLTPFADAGNIDIGMATAAIGYRTAFPVVSKES